MDGSSRAPGRRTLTPAVLASGLFTVACAVLAVTFVAARGGLQMPVASTPPPVAVASPVPTAVPSATVAAASPGPTAAPSAAPPSVPPSPAPAESAAPSPAPSPDPLAALPGCPDRPGCYEYLIRRGDSLSGVASRYLIPVSVVLAINPEITDPSTIVVGQILYLGRDPFVRLPACETVPDCSLYTVRPGDRLSTIAGRFGLTVQAILDANPQVTDPNAIYSGQVIRLPHPAA